MKPLSAYGGGWPLATDELVALAKALAARVGDDHAMDVARGDLSPATIRRDEAGRIDLPRQPQPRPLPEDLAALRGEAAGAEVGYLAPEQLRGEAIGPRTDVFAVGVVLYEASTGDHPFAGASGAEVAANIEQHDPCPPGRLRPDLPLEWDAIVACCLHKRAGERYASALDLLAHVEALERSGGTPRRRTELRWGRVVVLLGLVAGIAVLLVRLL